jgi:unsaturated chondroitin disaccharide hydrolase
MVLPACEFSKSSRNNASRHLLLPEKWTLNSVRAIAETLAHGIQASQHFLFLLPGNYPYPSSVITDPHIAPSDFEKMLVPFWELAAEKVRMLETGYDPRQGPPVLTVKGRYTTRGWTDWTQGFQFGIPLLVFSATGESEMLGIGKRNTLERMSHHLTHFGVHDHGFSNLSTYGNLLRCALTGLFEASPEETELYKLAVMTSGAVQARRWTGVSDGGYIHSFNGPHSLFIDTMRTLRILVAAHLLGQRMLEENGREVDLLERAVIHGMTTARVAVYYGEGRDSFDVRGRVAHESIFNTAEGSYRCPGSQQGYSGFTTWTRGLAWAMLGFAEFLEFLGSPGPANENPDPRFPGTEPVAAVFLKAAKATCDYYMEQSAADGIPYWDTGAPLLHRLGNYREERADPFNDFEPVDSSAAAIGAQGLIRLGKYLGEKEPEVAGRYLRAGLTILRTLLSDRYLSRDPGHQGILLHSVYHRPNGWDHIPEGRKIPCGESGMWGDYHMTELCYTVHRLIRGAHYTFFEGL